MEKGTLMVLLKSIILKYIQVKTTCKKINLTPIYLVIQFQKVYFNRPLKNAHSTIVQLLSVDFWEVILSS